MKSVKPSETHNFALIGHSGDGKTSLGEDAHVVATGGLAGRVSAESRTIERVEPFLTLEGLRLIFEKNRPGAEPARKERSE